MSTAGEPSKITISGTTLSSLLHNFISSTSDLSGLLSGHHHLLPPPLPSDDLPTIPTTPLTTTTITSSVASPSSLSDPFGSLSPDLPFSGDVIGFFSARRNTPLRPSMRDRVIALSLSKTLTLDPPSPLIFLLISSTMSPNNAIHTLDYKCFVARVRVRGDGSKGVYFEAKSLTVVNVGTAFRGVYGAFSPDSAMPWVACKPLRVVGEEGEKSGSEKIGGERRLELSKEGFGVERLERLVGDGVKQSTLEIEEMYGKMLAKLEGLARLVEESSAKVHDQEKHNFLLRTKIAGSE